MDELLDLGGVGVGEVAGVGYRANSAGVTLFTISSVHWADRIVATSSWNGIRATSAHSASGYVAARRSITIGARCFAPLGRAMCEARPVPRADATVPP